MRIEPGIKLISLLCLALFLLSGTGLALLRRYGSAQFHASVSYPLYVSFRDLLLRPLPVATILIAAAYGFFGVFRPQKGPRDAFGEFGRLGLLAISTFMVLGLVLLWLFKL